MEDKQQLIACGMDHERLTGILRVFLRNTKIHKRPRVRKSEKGLKIKGFQGFCANEEIIVTMLPKPELRVRFPSSAPFF